MERNARISIKEGENSDTIIISQGTITKLGNSWNIHYGDKENSFVIGISDGIVTITREGENEYTILLCEGKEYNFEVSTPYGNIPMQVVPEKVEFEENENGLYISLAYSLVGGDHSEQFCLVLSCAYID